MSGERRAALFGGSFDPVHLAHLALARTALESLALDEVRWVPAGQPWQKTAPGARAITPAEHRVAMVALAIGGGQGDPRFVLDRIEVERSGPSYTLDTVRALAAARPRTRWFLLIGHDQYTRLHTWHGWRDLLALVTLAVAGRPGAAVASPAPEVARAPRVAVPLSPMAVSATDIRERTAAGLDISTLVPAEVAGYIARHGLYRPRS